MLPAQFSDHLPYAVAAYAEQRVRLRYQESWKSALVDVAHARGKGEDIRVCLQRLFCSPPCTSGIEQSFSLVDQRLTKQRLQAAPSSEARTVGLLLASGVDSDVNLLCERARSIWTQVCPKTLRVHKFRRLDKGVAHRRYTHEPGRTEGNFLKRLSDAIATKALEGVADALDTYKPQVWTESHQTELQFQLAKRRKRQLD